MNQDNQDRMVKIKASTIDAVFQQIIRKLTWIDASPIVELLKQFEEVSDMDKAAEQHRKTLLEESEAVTYDEEDA
jgi:hypothetical protein